MLMGRKQRLLIAGVLVGVTVQAGSLRADLTYTGDVTPTPLSSWTSTTTGYVGNTSAGSLSITAGSTAASQLLYMGYSKGVTGTTMVDGTGLMTSMNIYVGYQGSGSLQITNGGTVRGSSLFLGDYANGTGTINVDNTGSSLTLSGTGYVGLDGTGSVQITNGGKVSATSLDLGYDTSGVGTVTVDGTASTFANTGNFYLGYSGSGTLNLINGATLTNTGTIYCAYNDTATATVNFGTNVGTIMTKSLFATPIQFSGTGTIQTQGLVSDSDLEFNSTGDLNRTIIWKNAKGQVNVNLDLSGASGTVSDLGVGYLGTAKLIIQNGVTVNSQTGYLGYHTGAQGNATVTGINSSWVVATDLNVGYGGTGTLNVGGGAGVISTNLNVGCSGAGILNIDGGTVTVSNTLTIWNPIGDTYFPTGGTTAADYIYYTTYKNQGSGQIVFGASGGTINTKNLLVAPKQLRGNGVINTQGIVSDIDLVFDANHSTIQTVLLGTNSVNLDISGTMTPAGMLGTGYLGTGSLLITGQAQINSTDGMLGYWAGSQGNATVDGDKAQWTIGNELTVGRCGNATLNIMHGGKVQSYSMTIGKYKGSNGVVNVDGSNSSLLVLSGLFLANHDSGVGGILNVNNGGTVTVSSTSYMGWFYGSSATANISGIGSTFNSGQLITTGAEEVNLNIMGGGTVNSINAHLGLFYDTSSNVNIDGAGSTWTIASGSDSWTQYTFDVGGFRGAGSNIAITNGGKLVCNGNSVFRSKQNDSSSTPIFISNCNITIDGKNSAWLNTGTMDFYGTGAITVANGGNFSVTGAFSQKNASDLLLTSGGTFTCGSQITSNGNILVSGTGALLTATGLATNSNLKIVNGGQLINKSTYKESNYINNWKSLTVTPAILMIDGENSSMLNTGSFTASGYTQTYIQNGGQLVNNSNFSMAGASSDTTGILPSQLVIDGANSRMQTTGDFTVTGFTRTLIQNGGQIVNKANYSISENYYPSGYGYFVPTQLIIDGVNSSLQNTGNFTASGYTLIQVQNGGYLSDAAANISSTAIVTIKDQGSKWVNSQTLSLGSYTGLFLLHGGSVQAKALISSSRLVSLNVDDGSTVTVAGGTLTNNGILQIKANALSASGVTYTPITAPTWAGNGITQTLGGMWNSTTHKFTTSAITSGTIGSSITVNTQSVQRVMFKSADNSTNILGLSLLAAASSSSVTITATLLSDNVIQSFLGGQPVTTQVLAGVDIAFSGAGYKSTDPVYLTLPMTTGAASSNLTIWHYTNGAWATVDAPDFYYDGTAGYFTASSFSPYLITATVPEPASLGLLALGVVGLVRRRK